MRDRKSIFAMPYLASCELYNLHTLYRSLLMSQESLMSRRLRAICTSSWRSPRNRGVPAAELEKFRTVDNAKPNFYTLSRNIIHTHCLKVNPCSGIVWMVR
jgi:hypothetical protein